MKFVGFALLLFAFIFGGSLALATYVWLFQQALGGDFGTRVAAATIALTMAVGVAMAVREVK